MRINCPYCGERSIEEFSYRGDATVMRPEADAPLSAFYDYVYTRDNPKGRHREHWLHGAGCRSWLVVERDTETHEIFSVTPARDVKRGSE